MAKTSGGNRGGIKSSGVQSMTFEQFASSRGAGFLEATDPALHRLANTRESTKVNLANRMLAAERENAARRESLRSEYNSLVQQGKVKAPSRIEELIRTVRGQEDNAATQAARRVLGKRGIKW